MPVALIEAAAAALPVVARAVGGVPELVVHERTGYLGAGDDELAFGLARLLDDPHGARAMGMRARLRVARAHAAETLAGRLEELYRLVCAERAAREGAR
jgi:glycosyltransferase involved in cell wall biosynthesis